MPETTKTPSLKIERKFSVSPEAVFDAFTKPEAMQVWWTDETSFDIDLRPGGNWTITRTEEDETYVMTGEYLEVKRPHRLRHTIGMPQFSPVFDTISIEIKPVHNGCEVTFVQTGEGIAKELNELQPGNASPSETGWQQGFDLMEAAWEKRET